MNQNTLTANHVAIVLAGGSGTRLWPLSRKDYPKQLLALTGHDSLLQVTARRLMQVLEPSRIITVTNHEHRFAVLDQLACVDESLTQQVYFEPAACNTLPAIAWAMCGLKDCAEDTVVSVFPSDHVIGDDQAFLHAWEAAVNHARGGEITLFGIEPEYPSQEYGYIETQGDKETAVKDMLRFVEKPDVQTAQEYIQKGGFYWNSGMFVFPLKTFLKELETYQPEMFRIAQELSKVSHQDQGKVAELYAQFPHESIDYGLMEHVQKASVVPVDMNWSDLGSWEAVYRFLQQGPDSNVVHGDALPIDSEGSLLWNESDSLLVGYGLSDMVVVQTDDATIVCAKDKTKDLKQLVNQVKEHKASLTDTGARVVRPWGSFTVIQEAPGFKIKKITVNPGHKLSVQMHHKRAEHWVVIAGEALVLNGEQEYRLQTGQSTEIPVGAKHSLSNPGSELLEIIEVQMGSYLGEDDIVRFEDRYGRAKTA